MKNAICYFLTFFAEAIILLQYASSLFVPRYRRQVKLPALCGLYLILFFVSMLDLTWLNVTMYLFINFIFLTSQYHTKWHVAFFHSAILTAFMGMCELTVYSLIEHFVPHFFIEAPFYHVVLFTIFSKILFFTIIYVLIHLFRRHRQMNQQQDRSVFLLVFIPLSSVIIMLTFINIMETYMLSSAHIWMIMFNAVCLLITSLLVFGINQYNQKKNLEFTEMQLLLQKEANSIEYYEMLLSQNENQSILIHDIKKHLQSIDVLNDKKEHEKIKAYIRRLLLSSDLKEISQLCDNEMLNAILCRYKRQCDNKHVAFHTDIRSGALNFLTDNDLTSLFCNLLDNALEAACGMPDSFIELNTSKREKTPFLVITVINSSRKNPIFDPQGSLTTQKADRRRHGFDMKSIQKIVDKYHGNIQMYYNDATLTFHTILTLKQSFVVK